MPNQKNQNPNGGVSQGVRESSQGGGKDRSQEADTVADRLREGYDSAREQAMQGYQKAGDLVARNPAPSLLIGFGVGFGIGLVLTSLLTREETWAEKHLPESLRDVPDRYQRLVDSLKSLPKTVHDHLPSGIAKHLG
jgi:hypothetical protein